MKQFILMLLLTGTLWSASIDTNLYEGTDRDAYYLSIQEQINTARQSGTLDKEALQAQQLLLDRIRQVSTQTAQIERFDLSALSAGSIDLKHYSEAVDAAASMRIRINNNTLLLNDLQSKLIFLKQKIERSTAEEKSLLVTDQLQFAYYKFQQKLVETKVQMLQAHADEIMKALIVSLAVLQCNKQEVLDAKLTQSADALKEALETKIALGIDLEKARIEENKPLEGVQKSIADAEIRYQKVLTGTIELNVQKSLCILKESDYKAFLERLDKIQQLNTTLAADAKPYYRQQRNILTELAKDVFGSATLFFGATRQESEALWTAFKSHITATLFVVNEHPISLISLFKALVIIVLGLFSGMFYKKWIARIAIRWPNMSQMSIRLVSNIGYYLIVLITLFIAVSSIGIDMTSISLIAGALSIGIGFGLQTVVSNFIAGAILMFERTIRIGDTIELADGLRGRVTDMRIRSTTIKTFDNIDIIVPNSSFIQNNVVNWTLEDTTRRLHIPFSVAYGTNVEQVKTVLMEALEQSDLTYIRDDAAKHPEIWMVTMNSSSVDFEMLVWIEWNVHLKPNSLRSDFLILIYNALYKHDIRIPFPQLDLYVKEIPSSKTE